jgi:hypothetical protein
MALAHWGFFSDPSPRFSVGPSVWDYLFGTQPALGGVRLAVFALSLFVIASLAALLVAGRWIRNVGGVGVTDADANDPDPEELIRSGLSADALLETVLQGYRTK